MLVPIGQLIGQVFYSGSDNSIFGVRIADVMVDLTEDEFGTWAFSRGVAEKASHQQPTRPGALSLVEQVGIPDANAVLDELISRNLVLEVVPTGRQARAFAENHQLMPLGFGLGNTPADLTAFQIGSAGQPRARVAPVVFDVWAFGHLYPSLWTACEATAEALDEVTTSQVLDTVLRALPVLLATDSAYIDVA